MRPPRRRIHTFMKHVHSHSLQISHWRGIREVLESNGTEVMITRVPATSSVKDRAKILMEAIEERYTGREVNLVGHSMVSSAGGWRNWV